MTPDDKIAELEHRLGIVEDELAIRRLQHAYGYYLDKCYYDEVVDLFDEDCEVIFIGGVYKGRAGAARLYTGRFRSRFADGHNGPQFGRLLDHPMLQDLIHVAPDRRTAYARYRTLMQAGTHELAAAADTPVQAVDGGRGLRERLHQHRRHLEDQEAVLPGVLARDDGGGLGAHAAGLRAERLGHVP